ncbi:MAG: hypothetical protein KDK70_20625 [Myxococcales bacterium]|nr:hypothetical protein [Myxococcales bacterium]
MSATDIGPDRTPSAARIYTIGEEQFAAGHYHEAVELWRHAVLALPTTADFDDLRHQLILRLAYGQLMAWSASGNPGYLEDAQQMLERYAQRHEAIFGESDDARARQGEIYELLFEIERRLEPRDAQGAPEDSDHPVDPLLALAAAASAAARTAETETDDAYEEEGEFRRTIVVSRARPSVDDPRIRALLDSRFTDPFFLGGVLTAPGIELLHGPRPLLRAGGLAQPVEADAPQDRRQARRLGSSLLSAARPALESCYEAAFARQPIAIAQSTVELEIDARGQVREATIVEGGLVDTLGDLCLVDRLESTRIEGLAATGTARIRLPMTFFYEGPVYFNEGNGRSAPGQVIHQVDMVPGGAPKVRRPRSAVTPGAVGA